MIMTSKDKTSSSDQGSQPVVYAEPGKLSTEPGVRDNPYLAIQYAITYQVAVTEEENNNSWLPAYFPEETTWEEMIAHWQNSHAGPPEIVSGALRFNTEWSHSFESPDDARSYKPPAHEIEWEDAEDARNMQRIYPSAEDGEPTVDTCHLIDDLADAVRRAEMIRDGAWQCPRMEVAGGPEELTALASRLLSVARTLTK